MAFAWYIVPYKRLPDPHLILRYCAMDDFTSQIHSAGGKWAESEILGNQAIVKVKAPANLLAQIDKAPGFFRLPKNSLSDRLSDLPMGDKNFLRDLLTEAGYTLAEIQDSLGNDLGQKSLGDLLRFMATRRRKPRYDKARDEIILDGEIQPCRSIADIDNEVV